MSIRTIKLLLLVLMFTVTSPGEQTNITAEPGHDVTLPCRAGDDGNIEAVEWTRPDLGSEYVLSYRDEQFDPDHQHPSFQQRVDLQDRQMKDGDVSLILKKVTTDDTGIYECKIVQRETGEGLQDPESIITTIHLEVSPSAEEDVSAGLGQTVSLPCRASTNTSIVAVKWTRPGLGSHYVLVHRDGQYFVDGQHPSYRKRVLLDEEKMKDGDASLVLQNVTKADSGRYDCSVYKEGTEQNPGAVVETRCTVNLQPEKPAETSTSYEWVFWVAGILILIIVISLVRVYKQLKRKPKSGPDDPESIRLDPDEGEESSVS